MKNKTTAEINFPVSEEVLLERYGEIMTAVDSAVFERIPEVLRSWDTIVEGAGTIASLICLHKILFGGLFEFAGQVRTCNISKGSFRFANYMFLNAILPVIEQMPQSSFVEITEKYVEMNIAHPFREGNGRVARLWLDAMLERELGFRINWAKITRDDYMSAMQRSIINTAELRELLEGARLEDLADSDAFMLSVRKSYEYETEH